MVAVSTTGGAPLTIPAGTQALADALGALPIPCSAAALTVVYPLLRGQVIGLVRRTLRARDADGYSPEEIADEAWARMYERRDSYRRCEEGGYDAVREARMLRSWILTCARRVALDRQRRQQAGRFVPMSLLEPSTLLEAAGTYEDDLTRRDARSLLAQVARVAPQIDPLGWRCLQRQMRGEPIAEIAAHYGMTYVGVKSRLAALRKRLRAQLPVAS